MFKMICKCGESLWNGEIPTNNELVVYTDKEWNNIIEKDTLNSWEIPEPQFDVWRCSKCERIYVFEEGIEEAYKVYKLEEISIDENIEEINRENEEIDKIINKMSKRQKAKCPKCGESLKKSEEGSIKTHISCPNDDFEILIEKSLKQWDA